MNKDWLYDKNGICYSKDGKAYDKDGDYVPAPHDWVLDKGISRAVCILQAAGVETFESCEGGEGHAFSLPTIRFSGTQRCGHLALGIAMKRCWPVNHLRRYWSVIENEVTGPYWELEFWKKPEC